MGRIWINNLFFSMVLTYFTGVLFLLSFQVIKKQLDKNGLFPLAYKIIKTTAITFLIPFLYLFITLRIIYVPFGRESVYGYLDIFRLSPVVFYSIRLLLCSWIVVFIWTLIKYRNTISKHRDLKISLVCRNKDILNIFYMVCKNMKIKVDRVGVYYSDKINTPGIVGVIRPRILLPDRKFSAKELEIIFVHELIHYQQRDVLFRYIVILINCFYLFGKKHNFFTKNIGEYSELSTDCRAIEEYKIDAITYYTTIADMNFIDRYKEQLCPQLYEDRNLLERRAQKMFKFRKKSTKKLSVVFMLIFFTLSISLTGTVSYASTGIYTAINNITSCESAESDAAGYLEIEAIEYIEPAENFMNIDEDVIEINPNVRGTNSINWNIAGGKSIRTSYFYKAKGSTITIMVSATSTIKAGIIEPDGSRRYINSSGGLISYTFKINKNGDHGVYIENNKSSSVSVSGVYVF